MKEQNAKIRSTTLGIEDHGFFTFALFMDYGDGSAQGAGGYCLDEYDMVTGKRVGFSAGITLLRRILDVVGVESWEDLPGKALRVRQDYEKVYAIGHFLKEDWLDFNEFFREYKR